MIEVIPAIIAKDFEELKSKIKLVEPYVNWAQLDVMDGRFVNNQTWNNPSELASIETNLNIEVHLMIAKPEEKIDEWIASGVKRIIIHYEATDKINEIIEKTKKNGLGIGLAINPETNIDVIDKFINDLDLILIMTVHPGRGGQKFLEESIVKIRNLRAKYSCVKIEVDGGINLETAPRIIEAGANLLVSGSAIFESENIKDTIENLKSVNENKCTIL